LVYFIPGLKNVAAAFELRLIVLRLHENKRHVNTKFGSSLIKKLVTLYKLFIQNTLFGLMTLYKLLIG